MVQRINKTYILQVIIIIVLIQYCVCVTASRINKGGAAFEVSTGPLRRLEPLAPLKLPPPRLQTATGKRKTLSKEELELKLKEAEERRLVSRVNRIDYFILLIIQYK